MEQRGEADGEKENFRNETIVTMKKEEEGKSTKSVLPNTIENVPYLSL